MQVVGARYTRDYEVQYLDKVVEAIGDHPCIELLEVTDNVDPFYMAADCLLCTSLNEVHVYTYAMIYTYIIAVECIIWYSIHCIHNRLLPW